MRYDTRLLITDALGIEGEVRMSLPHCQRITADVSRVAATPEFAREMRELASRSYSPSDVTELLCSFLPFDVARELRAEYAELPTVMAYMIVDSWMMADERGKPWTFTSLAPSEPIAFARKGKVRFEVDVDEDGVTLGVAHIHGRKAGWYQPLVATA